jgi:hypothetical protein
MYHLTLTNRNNETTTRTFASLTEALEVLDLLGRTGLFTAGTIYAAGIGMNVESRGW